MKLTEFLTAEFDREADRSRRALENMPEGKYDWKPHEKSMIFGYLASLVATMPSWIETMILRDEHDIAPPEGSGNEPPKLETSEALVAALDKAAAAVRTALKGTNDDHLGTNWKLLVQGQVVAETSRREMIQDTLNHWAHHRGQMTVYLRLLGAKVPALYGPSADENSFQ